VGEDTLTKLYSIPVIISNLEWCRVKEEKIDGKENYTEKEKSGDKEEGRDNGKRPDKIYWSGY
jgi:hypothetical protein